MSGQSQEHKSKVYTPFAFHCEGYILQQLELEMLSPANLGVKFTAVSLTQHITIKLVQNRTNVGPKAAQAKGGKT
jgi:hypothetical protein